MGIIFSGGIDSVIIAWLAKKMSLRLFVIQEELVVQTDIAFARLVAKRLDLELRVNELLLRKSSKYAPEVIDTIENNNAGQVEVASSGIRRSETCA